MKTHQLQSISFFGGTEYRLRLWDKIERDKPVVILHFIIHDNGARTNVIGPHARIPWPRKAWQWKEPFTTISGFQR